jgi:uncharacterized membrane protein YdfJ with MMPL/SSD domain
VLYRIRLLSVRHPRFVVAGWVTVIVIVGVLAGAQPRSKRGRSSDG